MVEGMLLQRNLAHVAAKLIDGINPTRLSQLIVAKHLRELIDMIHD
jgi:hypothetical protein